MFNALHVHTEFSLLDGAIKIDDLCKTVSELGQNAVAITDHGWISGAIKFVKAAKEAGIKPIVGFEAYLATNNDHTSSAKNGGDTYHLTLLAKNNEGYRNLSRLTTLGHLNGFSYKPRIDRNLLKEHAEGLIVLSGCIGAEIPQTIISNGYKAGLLLAAEYQKVHGENFFIELMTHGSTGGIDHVRIEDDDGSIAMTETDLNIALVNIADRLGVGLVATNDAHYLKRDHGQHHDTLLCIGMGAWKNKPDRMRFPGAKHKAWEFYMKSEAEMLAMSDEDWWKSACSNSALVGEMIEHDVVPLGVQSSPKFKIPDDPDFANWLATGALP